MLQGETFVEANRRHIEHMFRTFEYCLVMLACKDIIVIDQMLGPGIRISEHNKGNSVKMARYIFANPSLSSLFIELVLRLQSKFCYSNHKWTVQEKIKDFKKHYIRLQILIIKQAYLQQLCNDSGQRCLPRNGLPLPRVSVRWEIHHKYDKVFLAL